MSKKSCKNCIHLTQDIWTAHFYMCNKIRTRLTLNQLNNKWCGLYEKQEKDFKIKTGLDVLDEMISREKELRELKKGKK